MIPKMIHYCWFGRSVMSDLMCRCMESWRRAHPYFAIKCWNEKNAPLHIPFVSKALEVRNWSAAADCVRLYALSTEGGIYFDTDVEVLKPFDCFLKDGFFAGFQENFFDKECVCNAVMGAEAGHPVVSRALEKFYENRDIFAPNLTGPGFLTEALSEHGLRSYTDAPILLDNAVIYPKRVFYPHTWGEKFSSQKLTPQTYCIHHWNMSWQIRNIRKTLILRWGRRRWENLQLNIKKRIYGRN